METEELKEIIILKSCWQSIFGKDLKLKKKQVDQSFKVQANESAIKNYIKLQNLLTKFNKMKSVQVGFRKYKEKIEESKRRLEKENLRLDSQLSRLDDDESSLYKYTKRLAKLKASEIKCGRSTKLGGFELVIYDTSKAPGNR